jgi:hypothetical protein
LKDRAKKFIDLHQSLSAAGTSDAIDLDHRRTIAAMYAGKLDDQA